MQNSKDAGYDALIEHLRSKHIRARRHDDFASLRFELNGPAKSLNSNPPAAAPKLKPAPKSKAQPPSSDDWAIQVLEHLSKTPTTRPKTKKKLVSYVVAQLGRKITETEALHLVETHCQAGHFAIGDKGDVTYHLDHK